MCIFSFWCHSKTLSEKMASGWWRGRKRALTALTWFLQDTLRSLLFGRTSNTSTGVMVNEYSGILEIDVESNIALHTSPCSTNSFSSSSAWIIVHLFLIIRSSNHTRVTDTAAIELLFSIIIRYILKILNSFFFFYNGNRIKSCLVFYSK